MSMDNKITVYIKQSNLESELRCSGSVHCCWVTWQLFSAECTCCLLTAKAAVKLSDVDKPCQKHLSVITHLALNSFLAIVH